MIQVESARTGYARDGLFAVIHKSRKQGTGDCRSCSKKIMLQTRKDTGGTEE